MYGKCPLPRRCCLQLCKAPVSDPSPGSPLRPMLALSSHPTQKPQSQQTSQSQPHSAPPASAKPGLRLNGGGMLDPTPTDTMPRASWWQMLPEERHCRARGAFDGPVATGGEILSPVADGLMPSAGPSSMHPSTRSPTHSVMPARTHSLTRLLACFTHTSPVPGLWAPGPRLPGRRQTQAKGADSLIVN